MFFVSIARVIRFALTNIWRNWWLTTATIITIVLAIFAFHFLVVLNVVKDATLTSIKEKIDIAIVLKPTISNDQVYTIASKIEAIPHVGRVETQSADQALEDFKKRHQDDLTIRRALDQVGANPFGPTLVVRAENPDYYGSIVAALDDPSMIPADAIYKKDFRDYRQMIATIDAIVGRIQTIALAIGIILLVISVLVVYNTVRIAIYTHREEVGVMKLVGANNSFVRFPFMIESLCYSIIATVVGAGIIYAVLWFARPAMTHFFNGIPLDLFSYYTSNGLVLFGIQFAGIALLNIVGSAVAVGRYLNV